jgi:hypothetical protein
MKTIFVWALIAAVGWGFWTIRKNKIMEDDRIAQECTAKGGTLQSAPIYIGAAAAREGIFGQTFICKEKS